MGGGRCVGICVHHASCHRSLGHEDRSCLIPPGPTHTSVLHRCVLTRANLSPGGGQEHQGLPLRPAAPPCHAQTLGAPLTSRVPGPPKALTAPYGLSRACSSRERAVGNETRKGSFTSSPPAFIPPR